MVETSLLDALLPASLHQSQRRDMVERSILWAGRRSLGTSLSSAKFPKDTGFVFLGHFLDLQCLAVTANYTFGNE